MSVHPQRGIKSNQSHNAKIPADVVWHVPLRLDSCHPGSHPNQMMIVELFLLVRQHRPYEEPKAAVMYHGHVQWAEHEILHTDSHAETQAFSSPSIKRRRGRVRRESSSPHNKSCSAEIRWSSARHHASLQTATSRLHQSFIIKEKSQ